MAALREVYRWWTGVVFVAVLAEVGAAGYGAFETSHKLEDEGTKITHERFHNFWDFHNSFGYLVIIAMLVLLALALLARVGRPRIWWVLALAVAGVLQGVFANIATNGVGGLGFLHSVNALVVFALSGLIAHRAWRRRFIRA